MTTRHRKRLVREARQLAGRQVLLKAQLEAAGPSLLEVGRVLSAANEEKLRAAADNIAAVLSALGDDSTEEADADGKVKCSLCDGSGKIKEGTTTCPECNGEGKVTKESRRAFLLPIAEAYSSSAFDASDGAYILSLLLDLMSNESDEPDELPILQMAFTAISQWLNIEVAEIGTPEDMAQSGGDMSMWGWEAAHRKLQAAGGMKRARFAGATNPEKRADGALVLVESKLISRVRESALNEQGEGSIKIIQPGWGSSGYYGAEMLQRDGPQVFTAGTKMFWDHPTVTEEWERPERSLRDLAGETTADATWDANGLDGPGLYAPMKVFEQYAPAVNELAPSIGISIRAYGKASVGEAEGQTGQIIDELVGAESVDYVTFPGAGGAVLQLFESARRPIEIPAPKEAPMTVEADKQVAEARAAQARAEEALMLREAKDVVAELLAEAQIPDVTKKRLSASLAGNPPAKEGKLDAAALKVRVEEAVKGEREYLAGLTEAGAIRGMGAGDGKEPDLTPELENAFKAIGMSEAGAKVAAAGRSK